MTAPHPLHALLAVSLLTAGCASQPDDAETGVVCFVPAPPPDAPAEHSHPLSREAAEACLTRLREVGLSALSDRESRPLTRGVLLSLGGQGDLDDAKAQARERGARWLAFVWLARIDVADAPGIEQDACFWGRGFQLFDLHLGESGGVSEGLPLGPARALEGYTILADDDPRCAPLAREEGLRLMGRSRAMTAGFREALSGR